MSSPSERTAIEPELVRKALENYIRTDRFEIESITFKGASDSLLGFLGDHVRITVGYVVGGSKRQTSFFAKIFPNDNPNRADFNNKYRTFERETTIYDKIWKEIEEHELEQWHPKCLTTTKDVLLFEDLALRGYKMLEVTNTLDESHCLVALTAIARLHSAFIIQEENKSKQNGNVYRFERDFGDILGDSCFAYNEWFKTSTSNVLEIVKKSSKYGIGSPNCVKIQNDIKTIFKRSLKLLRPSTKMRNVLSHMDLWNNNMMFRYDADKPAQCMLVDFQACRLAHPLIDVVIFLYLNTDKTLRDEKLETFLRHYHREFSQRLLQSSIVPESVLPWTDLRESYDVFKLWGPVHALILFQFLFLSPDVASNMINDSEQFEKMLTIQGAEIFYKCLVENPKLEERYMSLTEEFIEEYVMKNFGS